MAESAPTMSPMLLARHQFFFSLASHTIPDPLVRITVGHATSAPRSLQYTIESAQNNSFLTAKSFQKEVETQLYRLQAVRWTLRKFLLRYLYRKLNECTTVDIVTLDPIQTPVHIIDWATRQKYSFEVMTLHKDITQTLLHTSGVFPEPLRPKNPLTNLPLSMGQIISVWNTFAMSPLVVSSAVSIYRSVRFCLARFKEEYSVPLMISSMKKCLMNRLDLDYVDYLLAFIENAFDHNGVRYTHRLRTQIETAVYTYSSSEILHRFRMHCVQYNYALLVKKNTPIDLLCEIDRIYIACLPMIKELQIKGNLL